MSSKSKKTVSKFICTADSGNHTFEIEGYSLMRGAGVGSFFPSASFTIGGFDWAIRFYPYGIDVVSKEYVAASLVLLSSNSSTLAPAARYVLRLVNHAPHMMKKTMLPIPIQVSTESVRRAGLFRSCDGDGTQFSVPEYMLRSQLEHQSDLRRYIVNDRLTIQCDLTVIGHSKQFESRGEPKIEVFPSDMAEHFGNLLKRKNGVHVKFLVGEETFEAHKIVLAARSPVFWAEFLGAMRESGTNCVTVKDMQPSVFEAMLHFIYNDSLPDMGDLKGNDYGEMMWHLLAAADRYAMDKLKLVCQT